MKKVYIFLMALLASASMIASAEGLNDTQTLWAKHFINSDAKTVQALTSQGGSMALATDGALIAVGQVGSTNKTQNILFGDKVIATGNNYGGNSANQALIISKVKADGTIAWTIAETAGEAANNENFVAATNDGGAVVIANVRHAEGYLNERVNFKDGKGENHEIAWDVTDARHYRGLVIKVDAEGGIEWIRELVMNATADQETYPKWSQSSRNIGQGIKTYAIAVDNEGNTYVGGTMVAAMTVDGVTIQPHNVDTWDGNGQTSVGNLFILKLDAEGKYVKHLVTEGKAARESVRNLKVVGNKIYMFGYNTGIKDTETSSSLGGKVITATTANESPVLAELDTDLNVNWYRFYESTVTGSAWQMPTLEVVSGKIYIAGTAKYGIKIGETTYTNTPANKARQSWLIQFDINGEPLVATVLATGKMQMQHGFFGVYEGVDGSLYAVERGLPPSATFGTELILYKLNPTTLAVEDQVQLADGSADGQTVIANGTKLFVMNRFANKNEAYTFVNSNITYNFAAFHWGLSAFQVPATAGGVESVAVDGENAITISGPTTLTATLLPANMSNKDIIWSSSDEDVLIVDEYGLVAPASFKESSRKRAAAAGQSAIITATSAVNPAVKASVLVTYSPSTGVTDVKVADSNVRNNNVFTIDGRIVRQGTTSTEGLPSGLYIAGGKKVIVK